MEGRHIDGLVQERRNSSALALALTHRYIFYYNFFGDAFIDEWTTFPCVIIIVK